MAPPRPTDTTGAPPDRLRTHAIEFYCRELCGSDHVPAATADVVASISPADEWGGDAQLLRVTRTAAARHAPRRASPAGLRGVLAAEHDSECNETPALLAQRANGELTPARQFKLENHLTRCLFCRAAEVREQRATRAFSAVIATCEPGARREAAKPAPPTPVPPAPPAEAEQATAVLEALPAAELPRRGLVVFPTSSRGPSAPRPTRRRPGASLVPALAAYRPFFATLALGGLVVLAVALALGGGASGQSTAASLPPPAPSSIPPAGVGIAAARSGPKPAPAKKPLSPTATTPTTTGATTTSSATQGSQASAQAPPSASAPVASAPAAPINPPAPSGQAQGNSGSSSGSSGSQPVVATQQGSGLPPQNAPTETIGGGSSTLP